MKKLITKCKVKWVMLCMVAIINCMMPIMHVKAGDVPEGSKQEGKFWYLELSDGTAEIVWFEESGSKSNATIPDTIGGKTVTSIGDGAFVNANIAIVTIPESVTRIGNRAFDGCDLLKKITISKNVSSIGTNPFTGCRQLNSITVDPANPVYNSGNGSNAIIETKTNTLIAGCRGTTIPDGVTAIADEAFAYCNIRNIEIPESVTSIGKEAFESIDYLEYIVLPSTLKNVGDNAFDGGIPIYAESGSQTEKLLKDEGYLLVSYKIIKNTSSKHTLSFEKIYSKSETYIEVPDTVTVNKSVFNVTGIGNNALSGNKKVKTVTCGKNITYIGKNAFKNCTALTSVIVNSKELKTIGANAFGGDKKLANITLKTTKLTKKSIGKNAFKGTNKKLVVKVPKSKVKAYKAYLKDKGNKKVKVK
ncbi:MAG: leucine-rich repeat domain-containing protein [Lachnospiraceae bacterium]|nr:leucine-rich repeat domain-containing protein [Lachnospiraceae bacterium]